MGNLQDLLLWIPGALFALTFHEYMHGRVAYMLGDPTAQRAGRLTLNPLAHLDLIGTIAIFVAHIGWAKPVPINPYYFKDFRKGIILVSIAGPGSNLFLALVFGLLLKLLAFLKMTGSIAWLMTLYAMDINVVLLMFNLIPLPPLDGSKVLFGLIKMKESTMMSMERFGPITLFALIFLGAFSGFNFLWYVISPGVILFRMIFA